MAETHVDTVVAGAGIGGLAAALAIQVSGRRVILVEPHAEVGGKARTVTVGTRAVDCGPTVLTMADVFADLLGRAGFRLDEMLELKPLDLLARHYWSADECLDLYTDSEKSAEAIARFAGPRDADGYRRFVRYSAELLQTLEPTFMRRDNEGLFALIRSMGLSGAMRLAGVDWRRTMWRALEDFFVDPRLRQLFGRYATYYGSSPFAAPATLNVIAHVEQRGVWAVGGGMVALARALRRAFEANGGAVLTGRRVVDVRCRGRRVQSVHLDDGTELRTHGLVFNGDPAAVTHGDLGADVRSSVETVEAEPSLSALTWSCVARPAGAPLAYHTVFFGRDYVGEFEELFHRRHVPHDPTVYVCAQDRGPGATAPADGERLLCLINAPARADGAAAIDEPQARKAMLDQLARCNARLDDATMVATTPGDFAEAFPRTRGSLYGAATHGAMAPFKRYRNRTRIDNFFLVGGAIHPGAGVPMVALGGMMVAQHVLADLRIAAPSTRALAGGPVAALPPASR